MIFASDLDNTLIYSYKKAETSDICVEKRDGKELSFMKPESYGLLKDIARSCTFVPVTTRTLEQYRRIDFGFEPEYAVVCHGARLLRYGEIDEQWEAETRRMLPEKLPSLKEEGELLYDVRNVNGFFIFAKSGQPADAVAYLKELIGGENSCYNICAVHNKVYIIPKALDKGGALLRLKEMFSKELRTQPKSRAFLLREEIVCAGDSLLDIPMLEAADAAIAPHSLGLKHGRVIEIMDETFTTEVLLRLNEILRDKGEVHGQKTV